MERQRSFSFNSTRFLAFSFTISSSLVFLAFFSLCPFKLIPQIPQTTRFSLSLGLNSLTGFTTNFSTNTVKNPLSNSTHLNLTDKLPTFDKFSTPQTNYREKDKILVPSEDQEQHKGEGQNGNVSVSTVENVLSKDTHLNLIAKVSTFVNFSTPEGIIHREKDENFVSEGQNSDSTSAQAKERGSEKEIDEQKSLGKIEEKSEKECDVRIGKWVYDDNYPLYTNNSCPFIDEGFSCESNGRLDKDYMNLRWLPQDCDFPRFNATRMLELMRGKRVVFVGDSLNRNQWESMMCMLIGAIKDRKRVYETRGRKISKSKGSYCFRFEDYRCTVEYYMSHYLVQEGKARIGRKQRQTLRIDTIDRGTSRWRGADILIFNTAHWWSHYKTKSGINYYQEGEQVYPRLDVSTAYRRALKTWASWVDQNINPKKTRLFFRTSSPSHFSGGQWNSGGHCAEATQPLNVTSSVSEKNIIVEEILSQMRNPISLLDITNMSGYRIDGHPSKYGTKPGSRTVQDCSHWCLPGVPDAWNELLYFHLLSRPN